MAVAVRVTDLHKSFRSEFLRRQKAILKGITLTVETGQIYGYLGPNGAGKTTTLKCLLGLIFPERGAIEILGHPYLSLQAKSRLGYLPENPYFYDYLTAVEFLRYYSQLHQIPKADRDAKIFSLLDRVGLKDARGLQLRKFSKGMLQRIGLAQSLLHDPELVLLDEPLGGLDPLGRKEIRDIIAELRAEGRTVLLSSHILQDIEMICDRVAIILDGRIVNEGPLHDLISEEVLVTEVTLSGLPENELRAFGTCFAARSDRILLKVADEANVPEVVRLIQERGGVLHSLVPRSQSLEDLFVGTVKDR